MQADYVWWMRITRESTLEAIRTEIGHRLDRGAGALAPAAGPGASAEARLTSEQVAVLEGDLLRVNDALSGDVASIPLDEVATLAAQYASVHDVRITDNTGHERGSVTVADVAGGIEHLQQISTSNRGWSVYEIATGERVYHHGLGGNF